MTCPVPRFVTRKYKASAECSVGAGAPAAGSEEGTAGLCAQLSGAANNANAKVNENSASDCSGNNS